MKSFKLLALSALLFMSVSVFAATHDSCAVEEGFVHCTVVAPQFDYGCSISCEGPSKAICRDAFVVEIPDPSGRMSTCELYPSECYCQ